MKENEEKLIQERKNKIHDSFGDKNNLNRYLFETLDNFYYRYIETTLSKDLHTTELLPNVYGALSYESNMAEVLKKPHPDAKAGIIELAKTVPRDDRPMVRFGLWVEIKELTQDHGKLKIVSEINWGFPEFQDPSKRLQKNVNFEYDELAKFRKLLALKLEEASELFN